MKRLFATLICMAIAAMTGFGQTITSASSNTFWTTSGPITSSGLIVGGSSLTWHGVPQETRKLTSKPVTLAQVRLASWRVADSQLAPADYIKLAKSVGATPSSDEALILQEIHDHSLHVYDYEKVDNYLYHQALKMGANMRWVWKPLRKKDEKRLGSDGADVAYSSTAVGFFYPVQYGKAVPMRVMNNVKDILACIPDAIVLVSDFEVAKPDPFLAISTPELLSGGKLWIVDNWDEPGFTDAAVTVSRASNQ